VLFISEVVSLIKVIRTGKEEQDDEEQNDCEKTDTL